MMLVMCALRAAAVNAARGGKAHRGAETRAPWRRIYRMPRLWVHVEEPRSSGGASEAFPSHGHVVPARRSEIARSTKDEGDEEEEEEGGADEEDEEEEEEDDDVEFGASAVRDRLTENPRCSKRRGHSL